jgi:endonuclease-3
VRSDRTLSTIRDALEAHYGAEPGPRLSDPFELILWEQVAYLADDDDRREAFELLKRRVGLAPERILRSAPEMLTTIAARGGTVAAEERAQRMRESARRVVEDWNGDLRGALDQPLQKAKRALMKFPMIGEPGAEKILLFTRTHPLLALESNGLRVLLRVGHGQEGKGYAQTYRNVRAATQAEERAEYDWLISLHELLRVHGRTLCRRSTPRCGECPLAAVCEYASQRR